MLKVWRGRNKLFVECTDCGSYGQAAHLKPKVQMTPEIEAAVERHTAHMMALREHYKKAAGSIANQIHNGSLSRPDGTVKVRELWNNHVAQVLAGQASLPSPSGKVVEIVSQCPWCDKHNDAVEVENLPEDMAEPKFSLARDPTPASSEPKQIAKGK
jgi:hypothetical protein